MIFRLLVVHRPLIIGGWATLLVLNPQNQLLMIKRTNNDSWGVPGGSIELGETIEGDPGNGNSWPLFR